MPNISLQHVARAAQTFQNLVRRMDSDGNGTLESSFDREEFKPVKIRDQWVTQNLLTAAYGYWNYPDGGDAPVAHYLEATEQAMRSLTRADADKDGMLTDGEQRKASKTAKQLVKFAELHGDRPIEDFFTSISVG